jgi:hypothetical protein
MALTLRFHRRGLAMARCSLAGTSLTAPRVLPVATRSNPASRTRASVPADLVAQKSKLPPRLGVVCSTWWTQAQALPHAAPYALTRVPRAGPLRVNERSPYRPPTCLGLGLTQSGCVPTLRRRRCDALSTSIPSWRRVAYAWRYLSPSARARNLSPSARARTST